MRIPFFKRCCILSITLIFVFSFNCYGTPNVFLPEHIDAFSRKIIKSISEGDLDGVKNAYKHQEGSGETQENFQKTIQKLKNIKAESVLIKSANFYEYDEYTEYVMQYYIRYADGDRIVQIEILDQKGKLSVSSLKSGQPSLATQNLSRDSLSSLTIMRYSFAVFVFAYLIIIVWAQYICARSPAIYSRKILTFFLILIGIVRFSMNWNTGFWDFNLISIGATLPIYSLHPGSPIYLSFYFPIGAICFLFNKKRFLGIREE